MHDAFLYGECRLGGVAEPIAFDLSRRMAFVLKDLAALERAGFDAIIDVRAPSEFAEDHLLGAINLPVLSDEERARVGTIYTRESPFKARKIGAALVAKNAARHIEGPLAGHEGGWRPLVYCWRGGQRSGSFATILKQIGWRVETLDGGYRSYRRLVVSALYDNDFPTRVILLDGNTGTAKTEVIRRLPALGIQTIDLEAMANHRGSALGGQGMQPSQKAFETALATAIAYLDTARPVVVEAESSRVGKLNLPPTLFAAMKAAPRIEIQAPVTARARYLCEAYADLVADGALLRERLSRLKQLQGKERVGDWITLADGGDYRTLAAELIQHHYDPRYSKVRARYETQRTEVRAASLDEAGIDTLLQDVGKAVETL